MNSKLTILATPLLLLGLAGCAVPAASETPAASQTSAPTDGDSPEPKPTATIPDAVGPLCYEDLGFTADEEHHGGDVAWPAPLTDDDFVVEPSCWVDQLSTDRAVFIAGWYGLTADQDISGPMEDALVGAGYQLTDDTNGITDWELDPGDGQPITLFHLTRTDGYFEMAVSFTGRA
ncbi:MAG: hypothetical protein ABIQ01_13565 [Pseudolysinimonas sp.]